jgi:hypothetical protein
MTFLQALSPLGHDNLVKLKGLCTLPLEPIKMSSLLPLEDEQINIGIMLAHLIPLG